MRSVLIGVVIGMACAGCLPEAKPAVGKHLVGVRDVGYVTWARGADGEASDDVVYIKQQNPPPPLPPEGGPVGYPADLWAVPAVGGPSRLVMKDMMPAQGAFLQWDAAGHLMAMRPAPSVYAPSLPHTLLAVDIATGNAEDLGGETYAGLSPSGRWRIAVRETPQPRLWALSVDGLAVDIGSSETFARYVGDRIFFQNDQREVVRVENDGSTTVVSPALGPNDQYQVYAMAAGDLLAVIHPVYSGADWRLLGTTSGGTIVGENLYSFAPSRDGRKLGYVLTTADGRTEAHVLTPGATPPVDETWELPPPSSGLPNYLMTWRPGTDEFWCLDNNQYPIVLKPGQAPIVSHRIAVVGVHVVDPASAGSKPIVSLYEPFNPDEFDFFFEGGRWWIAKDERDRGVVRLADASDPSGETGIVLGEAGEFVSEIAILEPGRRIAVSMRRMDDLAPPDVYTIDLIEGTKRVVATHAAQIVYGTNRVLVSQEANKAGDSGRLTLIDLNTGAQSVIAENVALMAVARPCPTCLPLDPGARTAFTIQARFPFEQDGVWTGVLP
jgi:hypothetical protein